MRGILLKAGRGGDRSNVSCARALGAQAESDSRYGGMRHGWIGLLVVYWKEERSVRQLDG
jgi:hypothetical protein